MTYEEFKEELMKKLEDKANALGYSRVLFYRDGFTSDDPQEIEMIRNTNIKYSKMESDVLAGDFIVLETKDVYSYACRFLCRDLYEEYEEDGWELVWTHINSSLVQSQKCEKLGIMEQLDENDYEVLKEKIFIRPLNFADHRYELKENIYKRIGDIVLVLYILASDENIGEQHNVLSIKLPRVLTEKWDLSEEEIWDNAMTNTYMMAPPRMYLNAMDCYKPPYYKGAFMALNADIKSLSPTDVPTVTTTKQMNGAIAMFYPGVPERIAELFGDDYYVAFTSIHDVRLHKKGTRSPRQILRSIKDINDAFDPADILSRKVYLYERGAKELKQLEL